MRLVVVESPYAGDIEANVAYARRAMHDCFERGEAPFASHILYTQHEVLDDSLPLERMLGIEAGLDWGRHADLIAVYVDRGISKGMELGIARARARNQAIEFRTFADDPDATSVR